jgi:hypothetical protein
MAYNSLYAFTHTAVMCSHLVKSPTQLLICTHSIGYASLLQTLYMPASNTLYAHEWKMLAQPSVLHFTLEAKHDVQFLSITHMHRKPLHLIDGSPAK